MVKKVKEIQSSEFDEKKRLIEKSLKSLDGLSLGSAKSFDASYLGINCFNDWIASSKEANNPDKIRALLYAGFQPIFDSLVSNNSFYNSERSLLFQAYKEIKNLSKNFLTSYYLGAPEVKEFKTNIKNIKGMFVKLNNVPYRTKERNIDSFLYAEHISFFIKEFLAEILDDKINFPDYFIGCACGSSEIVFPLAGITKMPFGFIRKSKRRDDGEVKIILEDKDEIQEGVKDKKVICVEDAVCTGNSLRDVMLSAQKNGASKILGISTYVNDSYSRTDRLKIIQEKGGKLGGLNKYLLK